MRCFRIHGTPKGAFQKCLFCPKRAFWGPQRSLEGLRVPNLVPTAANWSNRIGHMVTTHFSLVLGFFWAPRDPKGARFGPKCPFLAPLGPKLKNVADPSCDLSKFARGGHLINEKNSAYQLKEKYKKNYHLGQFCANAGPFGVPGSPEEAQYQAKM